MVAVAASSKKNPMFSLDERVKLLDKYPWPPDQVMLFLGTSLRQVSPEFLSAKKELPLPGEDWCMRDQAAQKTVPTAQLYSVSAMKALLRNAAISKPRSSKARRQGEDTVNEAPCELLCSTEEQILF